MRLKTIWILSTESANQIGVQRQRNSERQRNGKFGGESEIERETERDWESEIETETNKESNYKREANFFFLLFNLLSGLRDFRCCTEGIFVCE